MDEKEAKEAKEANTDGATAQRELTFGEKAVGLTFNPSGDPQVNKIKTMYAAIIDELNDARTKLPNPSEGGAMYTFAIRQAQDAQMWAVKAITWKD